jgi:hypothetical protein
MNNYYEQFKSFLDNLEYRNTEEMIFLGKETTDIIAIAAKTITKDISKKNKYLNVAWYLMNMASQLDVGDFRRCKFIAKSLRYKRLAEDCYK